MSKPFTIKQQLYLSWSPETEDIIRGMLLSHVGSESGGIAVTLASPESKTIEDQFIEFQVGLENLSASLLKNKTLGPIVFSITVRAYEYIPEISFPRELIEALALLGASIDIDVINMVEHT